jgi:tripartite-type tricarboxylate transporter receptor subunit TctC
MLADVSKVTPQMIGYRGSAPLQAELMAGHVPVAVDVLDALLNLHKASKLRILAVSAAGRSPELPDVPTMKEAGINIEGDGWTAIFAPASMPADKVGMLARAIVAAMGSSDVQSRFGRESGVWSLAPRNRLHRCSRRTGQSGNLRESVRHTGMKDSHTAAADSR